MQPAVAAVLALAALAAADDAEKPDFGAVQMQLSALMQASNSALSSAEADHQKIVDQVRGDLTDTYDDEAGVVGDAVTKYEASLIAVETNLQAAINASKAGLAQVSKVPGASGWDNPVFMEKAKTSALIGQAERTLKHLQRTRTGLVQDAERQLEGPLEDGAMRMGMVLGDLSGAMKEAKEHVTGALEYIEMSGNMTRDALAAAPKAKVPAVAKSVAEEKVRLAAIQKSLAAAQEDSKRGIAAADKELKKVLDNVTATVSEKADETLKDIKDAQHRELKKVAHVGDRQLARMIALKKLPRKKVAKVAQKTTLLKTGPKAVKAAAKLLRNGAATVPVAKPVPATTARAGVKAKATVGSATAKAAPAKK